MEMDENTRKILEDTRKLQLEMLKLVRVFKEICEKEHLCYFMIGGTMLGAVRHKGFIPWDDDVDFALPRKDYEKFLQVADQYLPEGFHLLSARTTPDYLYFIPRLTYDKVKVKCDGYQKKRTEDISIDIFPLNGIPGTKLGQYLQMFYVLTMHALYKFSVFDQYVMTDNPHRRWYEKLLCFLCEKLSLQKLFSPKKRLLAHDRAMRKYDYDSSDYVLNYMSPYRMKEIMPKSVFGDGAWYEFEGMKLRGPADYDAYLKRLYGDYMTPPAKLELSKHGFQICSEA